MRYTHLNALSKTNSSVTGKRNHRGVAQRNEGIAWIRSNIDPNKTTGVVYFADDDNTYSLEVFEEMRYTDTVSVWPVAFLGGLRYEAPLIRDGKVVSWLSAWRPDRRFATDMASFALNLKLLFRYPKANFRPDVKLGMLETEFLTAFQLTLADLEPKADNCTKVMVWHTKTEKPDLHSEGNLNIMGHHGTDRNIEV